MKIAGLFAGIGGFEHGLADAGHQTLLLCESWTPARAVLDEHFPEIPKHDDVRDLRDLPAEIEVLCAGFPCQDLSQAGRTAGISGARSGLVGEVFRLLEKRRVPWVLLENVPFMLQLGRGRALEHIVLKLEELGYRWAYRVLNTLAFGVPQRRERVFLLASLEADPADVLLADEAGLPKKQTTLETHAHGFYWTEGTRGLGWAPDAIPTLKNGSTVGIASPPAILLPNGSVIMPDIRDAERLQGFEADWTNPAERVGRRSLRWSLIGNAVSVPVAKWLGEKLHHPGRYERARDRVLAADGRWPKAARYDGLNRHAVMVSTAPCHIPHAPLHEFLLWEGTMLSVKATTGFLKRADASTLRFVHGFKDALRTHLRRLLENAPEGRARELDMKVLEPASGVDLFALEQVPG